VVHNINPRMPARFFLQEPPAVRELNPNRRAYRIFHEADWYGREAIARDYFSAGSAVYWIVRNGIMPMIPAGHQFSMVVDRDYDKTALLPTLDFIDSVWDVKRYGRKDWWRPVAAMSNAWYRGNYRRFADEKARVRGDLTKAQPIQFEEIKEHYPRYYFAEQVVTIKDRRDFVDKLLVPGRYPLTSAFVKAPAFTPARGSVRGVRETANTAIIDVDTMGKAFLVMSVTPHKYWRVTVDGRRVEPVVTNIGYQGIVVPAGRHRVAMRYRNDLAAKAMIVSIVMTLLLIAAAAWKK